MTRNAPADRAILAALTVVAALLAGCAGAHGGGPGDGLAAPVAIDQRLAVLSASVISQDLVAIPGAQVAVGDGVPGTSDEAGRVLIPNLDPGTHRVLVHALGYQGVARSLDFRAGHTTDYQFVLVPLPSDDPYRELTILEGMICFAGTLLGFFWVIPTCGEGQVFFHFDVEPHVETVVSELQWQPNTGVTSRELRLWLWQGGTESGVIAPEHSYGSHMGMSPLYVRADAPLDGVQGGETNLLKNYASAPTDTANPPNFNVILEQRITSYASVFYGERGPEGYSGRPDA